MVVIIDSVYSRNRHVLSLVMSFCLSGAVLEKIFGGQRPQIDVSAGCPLPSRLGALEEHCDLPHRGPGQSPNRKRILVYFEGHRTVNTPFCTYLLML